MEAEQLDKSSLETPLLVDDQHYYEPGSYVKIVEEDLESNNSQFQSKATTSTLKTCFNGLNALSGVGILSVPYALATGGWLSLVLLFLIAASAFYTGLLIKRCMDMDCSIRSYPDIGERAFGRKGKLLMSVFMNIELYLVATGFLILEGDNLHNMFPMGFEVGGINVGGKECFIVIVGLIVLPTVWLDNLSLLSYISASGVLDSFVILGSILWTGAFDGVGFHQKGSPVEWRGIPTAISLYAFCYCAHPVFPTLYTSMKNKKQFSNVLLICFVLCTIGYASMAVFGYLMFGSTVESQITLNLPTNRISSQIAIYTTLVNPIAKFALMVTPILVAAKRWFPRYQNKEFFNILLSTTLVISCVAVALAVPFFAYLMALVGAFLSVTASIIMPCLCYLRISGTYWKFGCEMSIIYGIILIGAAVVILGTYTSLEEIIRHL